MQIYDQSQIQQRPMHGVKRSSVASQETLGDGGQQQRFGNALVKMADDNADKLKRLQDQHDLDRELQVETLFDNDWRDMESEGLNRKGSNAFGLTDESIKWWDETKSKYAATLDNDDQRRAFNIQTGRKRDSRLRRLMGHESLQRDVSLTNSVNAKITSTIEHAALNPFDNEAIRSAHISIRQTILSQSNRLGWDAEVLNAETATKLNALHTWVIDALIETDAGEARAYYNSFKHEVLDRSTIEKNIKIATFKNLAQTTTDNIVADGNDFSEQIEKARNIKEPDLRDEVLNRVKTHQTEQLYLKTDDQKGAADAVDGLMAKGQQQHNIPIALWGRLSGSKQLAISQATASRNKAAQSQINARDDAQSENIQEKNSQLEYYKLKTLAENNPQAFKLTPLQSYIGVIEKAELKELMKLQTASVDQQSIISIDQRIKNAARSAGLDTDDLNKDNEKGQQVRDFISNIEKQVQAAQLDNGGKPLQPSVQQDIIDTMLMNKVNIDDWGTDDDYPVSALTPSELSKAYVNVAGQEVLLADITTEFRSAAMRNMKNRGMSYSEKQLAELWVDWLNRPQSQPDLGDVPTLTGDID